MATSRDLFTSLNTVAKGPQIIPGMKEKILCATNMYLRITDQWFKKFDTRQGDNTNKDGTVTKAFYLVHTSPLNNFYHAPYYYEQLLNSGIYCLGLVKGKLKTYESMENWNLPHYYDGVDVPPIPYEVTQAGMTALFALPVPIKPETHFKHQNAPVQKIVNIKTLQLQSETLAWFFIYSLSYYGVFVNAGHHMSSVGQILTLLSLYSSRFKDTWYQDAGVNMSKNVRKNERGDKTKFSRFNSYGLNRNYYHHFRMMNYPKEVKSKLRRMTGVGTDIVDYINVLRRRQDQFKEKEQIRGALKRKLAFWNGTNMVEDYLKFLDQNFENEGALASINATFLGVVNMRMPAVDYKIVLPAMFWFYLHDHKIFADFSAQSAYKGYQWYRTKVNARNTNWWNNGGKEITYASILAIFDLHQADQNIVSFMFKDFTPMTRADFSSKLEQKDSHFPIEPYPELNHWSKMYNGEKGGGGEEQASVVQVHAGITKYNGDDFIVNKPEEVSYILAQSGSFQIQQRLQEEMKLQYGKKHEKTVSYGTQKWYEATDVTKTNEELVNVKGVSLSITKVQPFFVSNKAKLGLFKVSLTGGVKRNADDLVDNMDVN